MRESIMLYLTALLTLAHTGTVYANENDERVRTVPKNSNKFVLTGESTFDSK
jgi:hypothetical protein